MYYCNYRTSCIRGYTHARLHFGFFSKLTFRQIFCKMFFRLHRLDQRFKKIIYMYSYCIYSILWERIIKHACHFFITFLFNFYTHAKNMWSPCCLLNISISVTVIITSTLLGRMCAIFCERLNHCCGDLSIQSQENQALLRQVGREFQVSVVLRSVLYTGELSSPSLTL